VTKLEREWAAKLKASGFQDLETPGDRDGPLSNRGHLVNHAEATDENEARLVQRIELGEAETDRRRAILHLPLRRGRRAWALHADGVSERDIAKALGITRDAVRKQLAHVEAAAARIQAREARPWETDRRNLRRKARNLVSRCDPAVLVEMAKLLLTPRVQPTRPSR
jgi:predicted transcriptional regulator